MIIESMLIMIVLFIMSIIILIMITIRIISILTNPTASVMLIRCINGTIPIVTMIMSVG